jgi:pyruvate/2-oxoglutarate dehydrogenase complex dihydrolipoamide acyltransferase (E2) component
LPPLRPTRQVHPTYPSTTSAKKCASSFPPLQIDVAVNAPAAGTIREFFANEEDTVVVGQDLVRLELSGEGAPKADSGSKEAAPSKGPAPLEPELAKQEQSKPKEQSSPPPPPEEKKAEPKETAPKPTTSSKNEPAPHTSASPLGNREERRVCDFADTIDGSWSLISTTGQDESHASTYRRASKAIPEHRRLPYDFQRG